MQILKFIDVDIALKIVLGIIMLSVGLSLRVKDFRYVLRHRRLLVIGLSLKLLIVPALAFIFMWMTSLSLVQQFGIMILLFSAGGTTSNVITYWFKGTTALTIFLTTISNLLAVFLVPVLVSLASIFYFGSGTQFRLPVPETVGNIIAIIILPALLGLLLHERSARLAHQLEKVLKPVSVLLLALVYLIKFFAPGDTGGSAISWVDIQQLLPVLLIINIGGMIVGFLVSKKLALNTRDSMTIGIELGVQNAGMAILIGSVFLGNEELAKPALLYAMFTFWSTLVFAWSVNKFSPDFAGS